MKKHKKLAQIGKTRSCVEFKTDKRLIRTFQEENILKMPSIESDIGSYPAPSCGEIEDLTLGLDNMGKAQIYSVINDEKKKNVKKWLDKQ
ncbi:hypothetical protein WR25_03620 [Diploscapter pachys]|uniref:Uncharacterized protein n=1 Tax=Diploscapter pachys TaxID=2018661 RepID=A0A2A2J1Z1_9BILA|nr:hypothetical protein WR25_03620 [Diploscapter pachys]